MPETDNAAATLPRESPREASGRRRINIGLDRFSGLYVLAALIIVFGLWIPDLFLNVQTLQSILSNEAITAIVAMAFLIPVAAGSFDLTVANQVAVGGCFATWAVLNHHGVVVAMAGALAIGMITGLVNALVIVRFGVDSFIATLGISSILLAIAFLITGGLQLGMSEDGHGPFLDFGRTSLLGLPLPVFYMVGIALLLIWILEMTPGGRRIYAVGGNSTAARLAGVRTGRVTTLTLVASGMLGAFAGVVLVARLGIAQPDMGMPYLLPAFTAVFLGATQIRPGRFNVLGTLVAIFLLATGVKGLQLLGAAQWVTDMFNGLALVVAVSLAVRTSRSRQQ